MIRKYILYVMKIRFIFYKKSSFIKKQIIKIYKCKLDKK